MSETSNSGAAPAAPAPLAVDFDTAHTFARLDGFECAELLSSQYDPRKHSHPELTWQDVSAANPAPQVGWLYTPQTNTWAAPPPPAPKPITQITPLEFMGRLTSAEDTAIASAAQTQSAILLWLLSMSAATYIDLNDARTRAGVQALVGANLLTADRATAILTPATA